MDYIYNDPSFKDRRQECRKHLGLPEVVLWAQLKGSKLGVKFRRQYGVGPYSIDVYCPSARLGIELDGESHNNPASQENDRNRSEFINQQNIRIVRFLNVDVLHNLDGVIKKIKKIIENTTPPR